jgi:cell division protein FtsI (penicillin-binding protein 3)
MATAIPSITYNSSNHSSNRRLYVWYGILFFILGVIILRLFYLQIIRHDYYQKAALNDQQKQYTIAAERGIIQAHQGGSVVPLVLNEKLYTLYADPTLVKHPADDALKITAITKGDPAKYADLMKTKNRRYVVLAKRLSEPQKNQISGLKLPGVGLQALDYRTYPQGSLAAQVLGFVNNDGSGTYGIEQQFNKDLSGTPGLLKAITDASGVPLAASRDNVQVDPKAGQDLTLTIDISMQKGLENILAQGLQKVKSPSGSALVIDPNSGAILAMANWPSFDPAHYFDVTDPAVFNDPAISSALEPGSVMKILTVSAALNQGVINPDTTYHDSGAVTVDGFTIKNVHPIPSDPVSIGDVLRYSLNTGAIYTLKQMGGGDLNQKGRQVWHDYMTNHYQLGKPTGIDLPNEGAGSVPDPDNGYSLNLQYANTSFGQGMSATMLQMAAAYASVLNGGTYYRPYVVDSRTDGKTYNNKPQIVAKNVVSAQTSAQARSLMQYVFEQNHTGYSSNLHAGYVIGGKTGTAQIPQPGGGYKANAYNGTFLGFVGGDKPQYLIAVLANTPDLAGYDTAGAQAAAPIFGHIEDMLINNFNVIPKSP